MDVVGIGAEGLGSVAPEALALVAGAHTVVGGPRHLSMLPVNDAQRRVPWPSPLLAGLDDLLAEVGDDVVVLASGDPLVSGVGSTLINRLGADRVRIHPAVSSVALARARMGWAAEGLRVVTVVGRDVNRVRAHFGDRERLIVLSADERTPDALAALLVEDGYPDSSMTVLGDLGAETESRQDATASSWAGTSPRLNIVAVECVAAATPPIGVHVALRDRDFDNDGQLTKLPLRLLALAHLRPAAHHLLWDVGTGAGSIAIEWARTNPLATAVGIEHHPQRAARARSNATRHGVGERITVVEGEAIDVLPKLAEGPRPDAVFFGGGATQDAVRLALDALRPGGRLVVHSVTLETDALVDRLHTELGGQLMRLAVEQAQPLGRYRSWKPARTVTCWAYMLEDA